MGEICADVIAQNAEEVDKTGPEHSAGRVDMLQDPAESGCTHTVGSLRNVIAKRVWGLNFSMVPYVMSAELVSRADAGLQISGGSRIVQRPFMNLAVRNLKMNFSQDQQWRNLLNGPYRT